MLADGLRNDESFRTCIDEQFLRDLKRAVPLHDIGKVGIPDRILLKPGGLTPAESEIMRQHVNIGAETIRSVRNRVPGAGYLVMAEEIASGHHEWFDGTGYQTGAKGKDIPLSARIVALADVYDALTTERPYKPAFSHSQASTLILDACGTQFDPVMVDAFRAKEHQFVVLAKELADPPSKNENGERPHSQPDDVESCYRLAPV